VNTLSADVARAPGTPASTVASPIPEAAAARPVPWLAQPRHQRIVLPVAVAIVLLAAWQWWVVAFDIPRFLVPSPVEVMKTIAKDWPLLAGALWVTVKITLLAFIASMVVGTLVAFVFVPVAVTCSLSAVLLLLSQGRVVRSSA